MKDARKPRAEKPRNEQDQRPSPTRNLVGTIGATGRRDRAGDRDTLHGAPGSVYDRPSVDRDVGNDQLYRDRGRPSRRDPRLLYEKAREREASEDELHQNLSDNYQEFLRTALENPDLKLFSNEETPELNDEQRERMLIIFSMLISLFERAYILMHERRMSKTQARQWASWEDYMREWCQREDFRRSLPRLLPGEDAEFVAYLQGLAAGSAEQLASRGEPRTLG